MINALHGYISVTPCHTQIDFHSPIFRTQSTSFIYWLECWSDNVPAGTILLRRRSLLSSTPEIYGNTYVIFTKLPTKKSTKFTMWKTQDKMRDYATTNLTKKMNSISSFFVFRHDNKQKSRIIIVKSRTLSVSTCIYTWTFKQNDQSMCRQIFLLNVMKFMKIFWVKALWY